MQGDVSCDIQCFQAAKSDAGMEFKSLLRSLICFHRKWGLSHPLGLQHSTCGSWKQLVENTRERATDEIFFCVRSVSEAAVQKGKLFPRFTHLSWIGRCRKWNQFFSLKQTLDVHLYSHNSENALGFFSTFQSTSVIHSHIHIMS